MWTLAAITLAALPLVRAVVRRASAARAGARPGRRAGSWRAVRNAMGDRSYLLLQRRLLHLRLPHRLPGDAPAAARSNLCGLPPTVASWSLAIIGLANIVGSLLAGSSHRRAIAARTCSR